METMQQFTAPTEPLDMGSCPDGSIRPADWQAQYSFSAGSAERDSLLQAGHASLSGSYAILGRRTMSERRLLASRDLLSSRDAAIKICLDPNPTCLGATASDRSNSICSVICPVDDEVGNSDRESIRGERFNNIIAL